MITGIIKAKDIRLNNQRFDCSYHLSEAQNVRRVLSEMPYNILKIEDVTFNIYNGGRYNRIYITDPSKGIKFLTGSNIQSADLENVKIVSKKYMPGTNEMLLDKDWVLITRSGTIGKCAYSNNNFKGKFGSEDIIRLIPNNKIEAGLVYAYLASKYGYALLTQGTFGAVIQHIEPNFIKNLPIPEFPKDFQNKIDGMIKESARLREEAADILKTTRNFLESELSIPYKKLEFQTKKRNIKDILGSLQYRLDPPAIMNSGVLSMEHVKENCEWQTLKDTGAKVRRPGIFKRIYVENGIPYIKGSEIFNRNPFRSCDHLSKNRTPFVDEMKLYEGQILLTCAGSVGDVKMITKEYEDKGAIGSQDIIRIETKDSLFTKEYLFIYLQLPFVYQFIQSMKYGSVIERIEPFHVDSIPVVTPSLEVSNKITGMVRRYMEFSYTSFKLEDEAISLVEAEIEKWTKE